MDRRAGLAPTGPMAQGVNESILGGIWDKRSQRGGGEVRIRRSLLQLPSGDTPNEDQSIELDSSLPQGAPFLPLSTRA